MRHIGPINEFWKKSKDSNLIIDKISKAPPISKQEMKEFFYDCLDDGWELDLKSSTFSVDSKTDPDIKELYMYKLLMQTEFSADGYPAKSLEKMGIQYTLLYESIRRVGRTNTLGNPYLEFSNENSRFNPLIKIILVNNNLGDNRVPKYKESSIFDHPLIKKWIKEW